MTQDRVRLIVGLGNQGESYRSTRHNIGFMVVDRLAIVHHIRLNRCRFKVNFGRGNISNQSVILARPMTFMNLSGPAVRDLTYFFGLDTTDVIVIHDDIDIAFGKIKIKKDGGHGGHKGLKSLIQAYSSSTFCRIRVGIGRPPIGQEAKDYVLGEFDSTQRAALDDVIATAQAATETILLKGVAEAMNRFHGKGIPKTNMGREP
ncbi:MAG: aminoacyl-tRNA hydrolase [Deltaproteobacteria bacterium]|nr:aminoacyl-tRNA hydrolase [Deltaproteobacteria bacterium]